jgi:hypothetical protein
MLVSRQLSLSGNDLTIYLSIAHDPNQYKRMAFVSAIAPVFLCAGLSSAVSKILPRRAVPVAPRSQSARMMADLPKDPQAMSDADWKQILDPKEYHVLRQKGTEPAGTGEYDGFYRTSRRR